MSSNFAPGVIRKDLGIETFFVGLDPRKRGALEVHVNLVADLLER